MRPHLPMVARPSLDVSGSRALQLPTIATASPRELRWCTAAAVVEECRPPCSLLARSQEPAAEAPRPRKKPRLSALDEGLFALEPVVWVGIGLKRFVEAGDASRLDAYMYVYVYVYLYEYICMYM